MSNVVSLTGYVPSPRFDGVPWTQATIGESALAAGPFTVIDTFALSPVDPDPTAPQSRSFTTTHATLSSGWYQVTFLDAAGNSEPTSAVPVAQAGAGAPPSGDLVVTFTDVNPPVRDDQLAWSVVQISEAAGLAGPWTVIDTQTLSPLDSDPSAPGARSFSTDQATVADGFYALTFLDAAGGSSHPIEQVSDVPSEIQPSLSDLGSFMPARTIPTGSGGAELGTFTAQTRPTDTAALVIVHQATGYVLMDVGAEIPDRMIEQARFMVIVYAAALVELGFYRNEVTRDQSSYEQYMAMYKDGIAALKSSIADEDPASPEAAFFSVPIASESQARFQALLAAIDPVTGVFDPTKLPVDLYYPRGPGGIPAELVDALWWLGMDTPPGFGDSELTDLESDSD